jgi:transposase
VGFDVFKVNHGGRLTAMGCVGPPLVVESAPAPDASLLREVEPRLWRARIDWGALRTGEGHPLLPRLCAELEVEYALLDMVDDQLRTIEKERDLADALVEVKRQRLERHQGVCWAASSITAREVFARSFASGPHLTSYLGLTPSAYDSGSVTRCQGISTARYSWARRILMEISWLW